MKTYIFDIETGPRPREQIADLCPAFEAPANYKDAEKIAAYVQAKQADWYQSAALSAVTGRVLAIGLLDADAPDDAEPQLYGSGDEAADLAAFWALIAPGGYLACDLVGFNSNGFDLPFLVRRSWCLGVAVPGALTSGRWLPSQCRDVLDAWRVGGGASAERISLDALARFLGVGAKTGSGADFASLWAMDPAAALAYLVQDLRLTRAVARRLGVLAPAPAAACPASTLADEFGAKA